MKTQYPLESKPSKSLAFSAFSHPMVSDRCMFKFFVLPMIKRNNQGTQLAQDYCLLVSKWFISIGFYWLCIKTTSLEFYKTGVFTKSISSLSHSILLWLTLMAQYSDPSSFSQHLAHTSNWGVLEHFRIHTPSATYNSWPYLRAS